MRSLFGILTALLFTAAGAVAQSAPVGVCKADVAQTISNGVIAPIPFASIALCPVGTAASSCIANKVPIYTSSALNQTTPTNPFTADVGGNYFFCAPAGHYALLVSASVGTYFVPDSVWTDDWSKGGNVNGNWNVTGTIQASGNIQTTGGLFIGNLDGNANTATNANYATSAGSANTATSANTANSASVANALAVSPSNCGAGGTEYAYGISANGNALCATFPSPQTTYYQSVYSQSAGGTLPQRSTLYFAAPLTASDSSPYSVVGLANSGVAAGSYNCANFSVDQYGRVTGASNGNCYSGSDQYVIHYPTCTPSSSTDSQCSGSVSFSGFADTGYGVNATMQNNGGSANLLMTLTGKSTSSFSYVLSCTYGCNAVGQPYVDVHLHHP